MKNFLLHIWNWLTGNGGNHRYDRYEIEELEQISAEEKRKWVEETHQQYEEESKIKKNRDVEFVWSLVGNIIGEHPVGENREMKRGTKHFSPGTKVYCFPPRWGDGYEKIYVIGRPRQSSRFIRVIIKSELVTNWRIQKVFSDHVKREMIRNNGWDETDESKNRIEMLLKSILDRRAKNGRVD